MQLSLLVLLFVLVFSNALQFQNERDLMELQSQSLPWKAGFSTFFYGKSESDIRKLLSFRPHASSMSHPRRVHASQPLPENFDSSAVVFLRPITAFPSRDAWKNCVHGIRNQGGCGPMRFFSEKKRYEKRTRE